MDAALTCIDQYKDQKSELQDEDYLAILNALSIIKSSNIYDENKLKQIHKVKNSTSSNLSNLNTHMVEINKNKKIKRFAKRMSSDFNVASNISNIDNFVQESKNRLDDLKKELDSFCEGLLKNMDDRAKSQCKQTIDYLVKIRKNHTFDDLSIKNWVDQYIPYLNNLLSQENTDAIKEKIEALCQEEQQYNKLKLIQDVMNLAKNIDLEAIKAESSEFINLLAPKDIDCILAYATNIKMVYNDLLALQEGNDPDKNIKINKKFADLKDLSVKYLRLENKLMKKHIAEDNEEMEKKISKTKQVLDVLISSSQDPNYKNTIQQEVRNILVKMSGIRKDTQLQLKGLQDSYNQMNNKIAEFEKQINEIKTKSDNVIKGIQEQICVIQAEAAEKSKQNPENAQQIMDEANSKINELINICNNIIAKTANQEIDTINQQINTINQQKKVLEDQYINIQTERNKLINDYTQQQKELEERIDILNDTELMATNIADQRSNVKKLNKELKLLSQQQNLRKHKIVAKQVDYMLETEALFDFAESKPEKLQSTLNDHYSFNAGHGGEAVDRAINNRWGLLNAREFYRNSLEGNGRELEEYSLVSRGNDKAKLKTVSHPEGVELKISDKMFRRLFGLNANDKKLDISLQQGQYGDCYLLSALDTIMNDEEMMVKFLNNFEEVTDQDGNTKLLFHIKSEEGHDLPISFDIDEGNNQIVSKNLLVAKDKSKNLIPRASGSPIVRLMEEAYTIKRLKDMSLELKSLPDNFRKKHNIADFDKFADEVVKSGVTPDTIAKIEKKIKSLGTSIQKFCSAHKSRIKFTELMALRKQKFFTKVKISFGQNPQLEAVKKYIDDKINNNVGFIYETYFACVKNSIAKSNSEISIKSIFDGGYSYIAMSSLLGEDSFEMFWIQNSIEKDKKMGDANNISFNDTSAIRNLNYNVLTPPEGQPESKCMKAEGDSLDMLVAGHALGIDGILDGDIQWVNPWDTKKIYTAQTDDIVNDELYFRFES